MTGTNGKTTTSRMIGAHRAARTGLHVGWSSTDGIYVDGELVEAGDYSGPERRRPGARRTSRCSSRSPRPPAAASCCKGIGVTHNDVSVVTNVSADHLGLHGIDTVDQLAEVKAVVPHITRPSGWAVLNGDDPRVFAMRSTIKAQPWVFSRDPGLAGDPRDALSDGGRATTVIDGWISVLRPRRRPRPAGRASSTSR